MYHPHFDEMVQQSMGMMGFLIFHPRNPVRRIDRDFAIFLNEWFIKPGTSTPDPTVMLDFNVFTFNSRVFPGHGAAHRQAGRPRAPPHREPQHGLASRSTCTATRSAGRRPTAGRLPETAWIPETTINVPPGTTRDVEFVADNPGDWALHCHKIHHTMNQMGHDLPIMTGVDQSGVDQKLNELVPGYMTMGATGMGDMMDMGKPRNSLLMGGGEGPFGVDLHGRDVHDPEGPREPRAATTRIRAGTSIPPGTVATAVGDRQATTKPSVLPARPVPGLAAALADGTPLQAVKAGSCASLSPFGRR